MIGQCEKLPTLYAPFIMYSDPLQPEYDIRMVVTSPVMAIDKTSDGMVIHTENSVYEIIVSPDMVQ